MKFGLLNLREGSHREKQRAPALSHDSGKKEVQKESDSLCGGSTQNL